MFACKLVVDQAKHDDTIENFCRTKSMNNVNKSNEIA
jgi:hypothetical protein